jgi:hypothetical protein
MGREKDIAGAKGGTRGVWLGFGVGTGTGPIVWSL